MQKTEVEKAVDYLSIGQPLSGINDTHILQAFAGRP